MRVTQTYLIPYREEDLQTPFEQCLRRRNVTSLRSQYPRAVKRLSEALCRQIPRAFQEIEVEAKLTEDDR